jgi:hypothetical protein
MVSTAGDAVAKAPADTTIVVDQIRTEATCANSGATR